MQVSLAVCCIIRLAIAFICLRNVSKIRNVLDGQSSFQLCELPSTDDNKLFLLVQHKHVCTHPGIDICHRGVQLCFIWHYNYVNTTQVAQVMSLAYNTEGTFSHSIKMFKTHLKYSMANDIKGSRQVK